MCLSRWGGRQVLLAYGMCIAIGAGAAQAADLSYGDNSWSYAGKWASCCSVPDWSPGHCICEGDQPVDPLDACTRYCWKASGECQRSVCKLDGQGVQIQDGVCEKPCSAAVGRCLAFCEGSVPDKRSEAERVLREREEAARSTSRRDSAARKTRLDAAARKKQDVEDRCARECPHGHVGLFPNGRCACCSQHACPAH